MFVSLSIKRLKLDFQNLTTKYYYCAHKTITTTVKKDNIDIVTQVTRQIPKHLRFMSSFENSCDHPSAIILDI